MKTTTKDVILLCKGWYNKEKYPTKLDALKQYYRKNYSEDFEEYLNESFLFKAVLVDVLKWLTLKYPDRLVKFIDGYLSYGETIFWIPDETNQNYEYQMFYRIVNFLARLQMRGDGLIEIDTSEYFTDEFQDDRSQKLRENLPWHTGKKCLKEDII